MKKVFVDIYLQFNLGDDLFLDILAKKFPDSEFTINYLGKNYDQFISQYKNVQRRKYSFINKIGQRFRITDSITNYDQVAKEHDALLFIGGSIFREEEYHETLYQDRMKLIMEFKDRNKSVFILGANFGPYITIEFLDNYKQLFELCDDVCFRDLYSYELFKKLPQVRYAPDIVFQMNVKEYKDTRKENTIGFSIIDVRHKKGLSDYYNSYICSTVESIERFVQKGYECCLMSFCEKEGDLEIIKTIKDNLTDKALQGLTIFEYRGNLKEAINLIASFKLFIAARFHANITGILLDIAIMPIIYSEKTTNVLKDINLDNILVNMHDIWLQHDEDTINRSFTNKINPGNISLESQSQFYKFIEFLSKQTEYRGIV